MKLKRNYLQRIILILIFSWTMIFIFLPNIMIFATSFLKRNNDHFVSIIFTLNNYSRLLDHLYTKVLLHSINMAFIATICCLLIGYPFAWYLNKLPKNTRSLMLFLFILPFWINSLLRIYGLKTFLGVHGWLNNFLLWLKIISTPFHIMYTPYAVVLGLVYMLLPFMVLPLFSNLEKLDKFCLEAARDLGANNFKTFICVILPLTTPGIIASCLLVFIPAMGLFYVSDLMGGAKNLMIGNVIKNQILNVQDWPFGAATSIVITSLMGLMLLIYWRVARLLNYKMEL